MNCKRIEKLLPLYVEGDLDAGETNALRAHLSACDYCRGQEQEFRVSQQRLHNFAAPDFGAEFYEQIRGAVLRDINSRPVTRPAFFQTLRALFLSRPAMAASLAGLVLITALSFGLYRSLVKSDAALLALEKKRAEFNPNLLTVAVEQSVRQDSTGNGNGARPSGLISTKPVRRRALQGNQLKVLPENSIPQSVTGASSTIAETTQSSGATGGAASTQAVARMEIQTSDPNIRIIWLGRRSE